MILQELWDQPERDITAMVRRSGNNGVNAYLSMGHDTPELAYERPLADGFLKASDIIANDWNIWVQPEQNPDEKVIEEEVIEE